MSDDLSKVGTALKRSMCALDDWLATYADDMCDPAHVEAARARIAKYGTLAYIADVQQQNREALASIPSDDIAKRMETLVRRMAADNRRCFTAELDEARAIVALLPEPVDADLVEARRLAAQLAHDQQTGQSGGTLSNIRNGEYDDAPLWGVPVLLAAIRRGRALERDSREG